ncbi:hypothetical protein [Streptomyces sp. Caat 7-52]|uniref:hypothetical protein n=1 Tax=Streptomyces sp. Caat 7-52 TaxID=2949637 RepID=UPI002035434C|nr:hypothetical protein [Streptomyces sp. Caat 7-52]
MPTSRLHLTVFAGATLPVPLSPDLTARLRSVRVRESDTDRSVFTLAFDAGRSGPAAVLDSPVMQRASIAPFSRITIVVTFGSLPRVLLDGIVTAWEFTPGDDAEAASLQVVGEDVSYLLDRVEHDVEHCGLDDFQQVLKILAPYATQRIVPVATRPLVCEARLPTDVIPTQHATDLGHLTELARRHGFAAYVSPGPSLGSSAFYWGPPVRTGGPQPALSVDLGPHTNVRSLTFRTEALAPLLVEGDIQDRTTGLPVPVTTVGSSCVPLSAQPLWARRLGDIRHRRRVRESGIGTVTAFGRAQAEVDRGTDAVVAEGVADGARYGDVLRPYGLVGLRGAGWSHDGLWYVRQVEHELGPGQYTQRFTLSRDGHGSTVPVVPT